VARSPRLKSLRRNFCYPHFWVSRNKIYLFILASCKKISCKDLGKGDCEGFLHRYLPKGTISFVQWRLYWCVLKGGTLYVFKSKDVSCFLFEEKKNVSYNLG
jgi:hypothetical protein